MVSDYVICIDQKKFNQYIKKINKEIMIVGEKVKVKNTYNKNIKILKYHPKINQRVKEIKINENGEIMHMVGSSGFAALILSSFFKPKTIFVTGFDGPGKNSQFIQHHNNKGGNIPIEKIKRMKKFIKIILVYLKKKNINIISSKNHKFWGVDKKYFDIQTPL